MPLKRRIDFGHNVLAIHLASVKHISTLAIKWSTIDSSNRRGCIRQIKQHMRQGQTRSTTNDFHSHPCREFDDVDDKSPPLWRKHWSLSWKTTAMMVRTDDDDVNDTTTLTWRQQGWRKRTAVANLTGTYGCLLFCELDGVDSNEPLSLWKRHLSLDNNKMMSDANNHTTMETWQRRYQQRRPLRLTLPTGISEKRVWEPWTGTNS